MTRLRNKYAEPGEVEPVAAARAELRRRVDRYGGLVAREDDTRAMTLGYLYAARVALARALRVDVLDLGEDDLGPFDDLPTAVQIEARSRYGR